MLVDLELYFPPERERPDLADSFQLRLSPLLAQKEIDQTAVNVMRRVQEARCTLRQATDA